MKKLKEIKGFNNLYLYNNSIIVSNKESIQIINEDINTTPLVEGNIFVINVLGDNLFYQLDNESNIHIYGKDTILNDGFSYGLISALM